MDDPVFPAHTVLDGKWRNSNFTGGVLACVDKTMICEPDGIKCTDLWDPDSEYMKDSPFRPAIKMLIFPLLPSRMDFSINYRLGNALDAQSKLVQKSSLPLAAEQWEVEVQQLFETSLARIQIEAWTIARGTGTADLPGLDILDNPDLPFREMCRLFKFRSVGWKNINVSGVAFCVVGGLLVIICSVKKEEQLWIEGLPSILRTSCSSSASKITGFCGKAKLSVTTIYTYFKVVWLDSRRNGNRRGVTTISVEIPLGHLNRD
jgi:hypothetical protein